MEAIIITIIGWIITILIAVYAAKSGSKDTTKKLAALEGYTSFHMKLLALTNICVIFALHRHM